MRHGFSLLAKLLACVPARRHNLLFGCLHGQSDIMLLRASLQEGTKARKPETRYHLPDHLLNAVMMQPV